MRLSKVIFQEKFRKFQEHFNDKDLVLNLGLASYIDAGFLFFSPFGKILLENINNLIIDYLNKKEFYQVQIPLIHKKDLLLKSGKYQDFSDQIFEFENRVLLATSEEYLLELFEKNVLSHYQLPLRYFALTECFRNIKRPEGTLKTKQFGGVVIITLDKNEKEFIESMALFEETTDCLFQKINVSFVKKEKNNGIEYIFPYDNGEIFECDGKKIVGLSLAMGYRYLDSEKFNVRYVSSTNELKQIVVGTYGIGTQRILLASLKSNLLGNKINLPEKIKPFEKVVIPIKIDEKKQVELADRVYNILREKYNKIYLDDRKNLTLKEKLDFADFWSVNEKYLIGDEEVRGGRITIKKGENVYYKNLEDLLKNEY